MGKDWLNIKLKTQAKDFDYVRTKIEGWPEEVMRDVYEPAVNAIASEGAALIRHIVESDTNTLKYETTGVPGRLDTHKMRNSVRYRQRARSKNGFALFVGWLRGEPGYTIFQEQGTKNGVRAMNSIGQAQELMLAQLRALAKGTYKGSYTTNTESLGD